MASITKVGDVYKVRWRTLAGEGRAKRCPTKRSADRLKLDVEEAHARGADYEPRGTGQAGEPLVSEVMRAYVADVALGLRAETSRRYATALSLFHRFLHQHTKSADPGISVLSVPLLHQYRAWLHRPETALHGDKRHQDGTLKGKPRALDTVRKLVEVVHIWWKWADNSERWPDQIPRPRQIELKRGMKKTVVAPTWAEMQSCIAAAPGWQHKLLTWLYYTGLRVTESMLVTWADLDLERGTLRLREEIVKTMPRTVPLHPALLDLVSSWGVRKGYVIPSGRTGQRQRQARARDIGRAWERAGVRREVWVGRPDHAFRKGFKTNLLELGAHEGAVDFLQGHEGEGARHAYIDPRVLPLEATLALIPRLGSAPASNVVQLGKPLA